MLATALVNSLFGRVKNELRFLELFGNGHSENAAFIQGAFN